MTGVRGATGAEANDNMITADAGTVAAVLAEREGHQWNTLSPLRREFARGASAVASDSRAMERLRNNDKLQSVSRLITQPDVRVTLRLAAPGQEPSAYVGCLRRDAGERVVVVLPQGGKTISILGCPDVYSFVASWAVMVASHAESETPNDLPPPWPVQDLMLALHAADSYRRAKRLADASYSRDRRITVGAKEFSESLVAASASDNTSWLLPAFLTVTPGLEYLDLTPARENLAPLFERRILQMSESRGQSLLGFGECGTRMGEEFINGIALACGFEIAVWADDRAQVHARAFLTSTPRANHLIEIIAQPDGGAVANHQALTQRQLMARLVGMHTAALDERATHPSLAASRRSGDAREPARDAVLRVAANVANRGLRCGECGFMNPAGMRFCGQCANPLGAAEHAPAAPTKKTATSRARAPQSTAPAAAARAKGSPAKDATPAAPSSTPPAARPCPNCHRPSVAGEKFCRTCGTRIQEEVIRHCSNPSCRRRIAAGKKFCTNCGTPAE